MKRMRWLLSGLDFILGRESTRKPDEPIIKSTPEEIKGRSQEDFKIWSSFRELEVKNGRNVEANSRDLVNAYLLKDDIGGARSVLGIITFPLESKGAIETSPLNSLRNNLRAQIDAKAQELGIEEQKASPKIKAVAEIDGSKVTIGEDTFEITPTVSEAPSSKLVETPSGIDYDELERDFENFRKLVKTNIEEFSNIEKTLRVEIDGDFPSLKSLIELVEILEIKNNFPYWQKTNIFPSDQQQLQIKKEVIALLNRAVTLHTLEASIAFLWLAEKQESIEKQCDYFRASLRFGIARGLTSAYKYWGLAMHFSDNPTLTNDALNAFAIAVKEGLNNIHPDKEPARSIWLQARNLDKIITR